MLYMARADQLEGRSRAIGAEAAAQILGVSVRTVHRWRLQRKLPPASKNPGGTYTWSRRDIELFVDCGMSLKAWRRAKRGE